MGVGERWQAEKARPIFKPFRKQDWEHLALGQILEVTLTLDRKYNINTDTSVLPFVAKA